MGSLHSTLNGNSIAGSIQTISHDLYDDDSMQGAFDNVPSSFRLVIQFYFYFLDFPNFQIFSVPELNRTSRFLDRRLVFLQLLEVISMMIQNSHHGLANRFQQFQVILLIELIKCVSMQLLILVEFRLSRSRSRLR